MSSIKHLEETITNFAAKVKDGVDWIYGELDEFLTIVHELREYARHETTIRARNNDLGMHYPEGWTPEPEVVAVAGTAADEPKPEVAQAGTAADEPKVEVAQAQVEENKGEPKEETKADAAPKGKKAAKQVDKE